uniref:Leucine-rich repeat protein n=1 Tax=Parastrongyloides trichosuri TaxID=131310 RepID=A0A0N4ZW69_PARTI
MFTTAEKIFSGISNLKSRYYKYLEKLCISNGINISQLKNEGSKQMVLEMFFGGYNVMVGLKYFSNLKVLKLVNQEIVSLRPLNDICNSLEEFWLVEGILHDLTGIEHCKKLKRLYLYENKIEDGKLIGNLNNLEVLWIGENDFKCFNFIKNLENLTDLRINGTQCTDSNLISIAIWPPKLQILDISNNQLTSPQPLILSCCCYMLQSIYIDWDFEDESKLKCSYKLIELLIYQFRYLSKINGESISDNKKILIKTSAEKTFLKTASLIMNERDNLIDEINEIEKNYVKIKEKLYFFVVGLEKAKNNASKREGRKHIASRLHEQCLYNLKNLKKIKSLAIEYEHLSFSLREYFININNLESI